MGLGVSAFTKKRIIDIKDSEDTIDIEYCKRIQAIRTRQDLVDLLHDYEEFLPQGLQKFRECDHEEFVDLMTQASEFVSRVQRRLPQNMAVTEAIMLVQPPMLSIPRALAQSKTAEEKKYHTWGMAWMRLSNRGLISRLAQQSEMQMEHVIEIKEKMSGVVNERIDEGLEAKMRKAPKINFKTGERV